MSLALLYAAVFAGGVLTILSPCILPVLPFVFAARGRAREPALRDAVPLLAGLVLAFALVATAGTVGAAWVATAADVGRGAAIAAVAMAGLALLSPRLAGWAARPAVRLGSLLAAGRTAADTTDTNRGGRAGRQLVLGAATGFLWAPCAGPILALVVAGAAAGGRPALAASLFATFGLGAAASLAVALAAGDRVLAALKRLAGGAGELWVRRGLGAAALAAAALIALGYDAQVFAGGGLVRTAGAEEVVLRRLVPDRTAAERAFVAPPPAASPAVPPVPTPDEGPLPSFAGATGWLNTPADAPLAAGGLRGKVVVVNVWTFACYNCLNALPHVKALAAKYRGQDVVVVGVHTPELARERVPANVADAVQRLGVTYPVAVDANFTIWRAFHNEYWPSVYIADRAGRVRFHHFGEGRYGDEDRVVAQLLAEPAPAPAPAPAAPAARTAHPGRSGATTAPSHVAVARP